MKGCFNAPSHSTKTASVLKTNFIDYTVSSSFIDFDGTWFANISGSEYVESLQGTTEPEVIFKASVWICKLELQFKLLLSYVAL